MPNDGEEGDSSRLHTAGESMPRIAKNIEGATTLRTFQQNSSACQNSTEGDVTELTNSMLNSNGPSQPFTEQ